MPMQVNTLATAFCSAAQMLTYYDYNLIGQLASDTGDPVSPTGLLTDPNLAAALNAAAGDIEATCSVAGRYLPTDLQALLANGGNGANRLIKLNADLAFATMRERRGYRTEEEFPQIKRAFELMERLRLGERVFSFIETEKAGVGSRQNQGVCVQRTIPLATSVAFRYFGRRAWMYRFPPGGDSGAPPGGGGPFNP